MKTFPRYDRHVHINTAEKWLKVDVTAGTQCGTEIAGQYVVTLTDTKAKATQSATLRATSFAVSRLKQAHADVVADCQRRGNHDH